MRRLKDENGRRAGWKRRGTVFLIVVLVTYGSAWAASLQPAPSLRAIPENAPPGGTIQFIGENWPAEVQLAARLYEAANVHGSTASLAMSFHADGSGRFAVSGEVPRTLSGAGSRDILLVVPGNYVVVVSAGPALSARAPLEIGAPVGQALLWGEARFDLDRDGSPGPADPPARVRVTADASAPGREGFAADALTDARGRFVFVPLAPGPYGVAAGIDRDDTTWAAATGIELRADETGRADLLLQARRELWLAVFGPTQTYSITMGELWIAQAGDWYRVIDTEGAWALVVWEHDLPAWTVWISLQNPVQLVAA